MFDNFFGGLSSGLGNLTDGFTNFTNNLGGMMDNLGQSTGDWFSNLGTGGSTANIGTTMAQDLANGGTGITGGGSNLFGGSGFGFNLGTAQTLGALGQSYVGYQQMKQSQEQMDLARKGANLQNKAAVDARRASLAKQYANSGGMNSETSSAMNGLTQQEYVDMYAPTYEAL